MKLDREISLSFFVFIILWIGMKIMREISGELNLDFIEIRFYLTP